MTREEGEERMLDDPAAHLGIVIDWTRHASRTGG